MRVVTWNVWGRYGPWRERAPRIAATLRDLRPDVVCLQEVWSARGTTHAHELAAALGLHPVYSPTRMPPVEPGSGADGLGVAVLSRWPVTAVRREALPSAAPASEDGEDGEDGEPPVALVVTADHPSGALHVVTAVPDWEQTAGAVRLAQCRALADLVRDPRLDGAPPVVLAADLNAAPGTEALTALTDVLVDAWAAAGPGEDRPTYAADNRWVEAGEWLAGGRIDHVLLRPGSTGSPVTVRSTALAGTGDPPPSDHYAVVADLEW